MAQSTSGLEIDFANVSPQNLRVGSLLLMQTMKSLFGAVDNGLKQIIESIPAATLCSQKHHAPQMLGCFLALCLQHPTELIARDVEAMPFALWNAPPNLGTLVANHVSFLKICFGKMTMLRAGVSNANSCRLNLVTKFPQLFSAADVPSENMVNPPANEIGDQANQELQRFVRQRGMVSRGYCGWNLVNLGFTQNKETRRWINCLPTRGQTSRDELLAATSNHQEKGKALKKETNQCEWSTNHLAAGAPASTWGSPLVARVHPLPPKNLAENPQPS
jgi:hypothetical protein